MAFDKIVDSSALDAGLKQIADAIREKDGSVGALSFPDGMVNSIINMEMGIGKEVVINSVTSEDTSRIVYVSHNGLEECLIRNATGKVMLVPSLIYVAGLLNNEIGYQSSDTMTLNHISGIDSSVLSRLFYIPSSVDSVNFTYISSDNEPT